MRRPYLRALKRTASLPSGVLGPVDFWALRLLASCAFSEISVGFSFAFNIGREGCGDGGTGRAAEQVSSLAGREWERTDFVSKRVNGARGCARMAMCAEVAQLVEHRIRNARVDGSSPFFGSPSRLTPHPNRLRVLFSIELVTLTVSRLAV